MVDLVLEDPGEKSGAPNHDTPAPNIPGGHLHCLRATDLAEDPRDTETAFRADLTPPPPAQPGIHERDRTGARIRQEHPQRHPDLNRGEAYSAGAVHRHAHIRDQAPDRCIDNANGAAACSQDPLIGIAHGHNAAGASPHTLEAGDRSRPGCSSSHPDTVGGIRGNSLLPGSWELPTWDPVARRSVIEAHLRYPVTRTLTVW